MPPRVQTAETVRQAREQRIRCHFKAGAGVSTLAWWYHHTPAEIEAIIRRGLHPRLKETPCLSR